MRKKWTAGDRCWYLLEAQNRSGLEFSGLSLNELRLEEKFTCSVYLHTSGDSEPLVRLLSSDLLTSIVYPYEALSGVLDPSLEVAMEQAYLNGLDSYQVTLLMAWLCGSSKKAQDIFDEQIKDLDEESILEQIELLLRFQPERIKPLLQKIDRHTNTPYAKLALVSIGEDSANTAMRYLLEEEASRTVRETAARSLGGWLEKHNVEKKRTKTVDDVEEALKLALKDEDPRVQIAAIQSLGFASSRALSWLQDLEVQDDEAKVEIVASIRAISGKR